MVLHKTIADKNGGRQVECSAAEEKKIRAEWALEEFKKKAVEEGRILANRDLTVDEMKEEAKKELCLSKDFPLQEIAEAQLIGDTVKLKKIRDRKLQLNAAYKDLCDTLDAEDKDAKKILKAQFKRPVL